MKRDVNMAKTLNLQIVTPEGIAYSEDVEMVGLRSSRRTDRNSAQSHQVNDANGAGRNDGA